ncbi:CU044_5270 family protein [Streptomyces sp. NPDC002676]
MNADNLPHAGTPRSQAEELLASSEWDLSPSRHLQHKEVLMQQIDRDRDRDRSRDREHTLGTLPSPASPRRRLPRPALVLPLASMAVAGALVVTLSGGGHGPAPATAAPGANAGRTDASVTLDRIAAAAMTTDQVPVKDGQFVYVRSLIRENKGTFGGPVRLGALHSDEFWMSQNPAPVARTGWMRETGKDAVTPGEVIPVESTTPVPVGIDRPTYKWLASLPTDPDALLKLLYSHTRVEKGDSKDQAVFERIGELLNTTIMPPANASALYKAVERIPGVTGIPDAVDAAGRHGIGITREDAGSATRSEWIFDKHTLTYLGSRAYMTKNKVEGAEADTLYGTDAVMERAVVDQHGKQPAKTHG